MQTTANLRDTYKASLSALHAVAQRILSSLKAKGILNSDPDHKFDPYLRDLTRAVRAIEKALEEAQQWLDAHLSPSGTELSKILAVITGADALFQSISSSTP